MRVGEFWEAIAAYRQARSEERRHTAELTRGATMKLWNLHVDKRYRINDPRKFWPMPWDEDDAEAEDREVRRLNSLGDEERDAEVQKLLARIHHGSKPQSKGQR